ncbi:hypothetical protein HLB44_35360 [Aquincola sp. S2]|uniref:Caspase family protein n=1 Tax=Pseudaquabacterium terrae TaxID=2732868 RepID=A0ABX2EUX4_9BURK|nr:hypothetical protein [Aquabacterium terrae]NRF72277.1 hypothetical protein [Aquabacterium terrae]
MPGVLAWIVAVERHYSRLDREGRRIPNPLDFEAPISRRALDWVEWLVAERPGTQLVLNLALDEGSAERERLEKLRGRVLNAASAHLADASALDDAVDCIEAAAPDTLLIVWRGHGVIHGRERYLLHAGSRGYEGPRTWDLDSLLKRLRSGQAPTLQIGFIDACADVVAQAPQTETLAGTGDATCDQFYYFAASVAAQASMSDELPTLTSVALEAMMPLAWDPARGPSRDELHARLMPLMKALDSRPVAWHWTQGSGESWSGAAVDALSVADLRRCLRRTGLPGAFFERLWHDFRPIGLTSTKLATAILNGTLPTLVDDWRARAPDHADLFQESWNDVSRVMPWVAPLYRLGLGLTHWAGIAQVLAAERASGATPRFTDLAELLLWVVEGMYGPGADGMPRAERALLTLMVLALKEARRLGGGTGADALEGALRADAALGPRLAAIGPQAALPPRPPVLIVMLRGGESTREPSIERWWVQSNGVLEPGTYMPAPGRLGQSLARLIESVQKGQVRLLRVELLAPRPLLWGRFDWRGYQLGGTPKVWVALDKRYPMYWRWSERLHERQAEELQAGYWRVKSREVLDRARSGGTLECRFDDDAPLTVAAPPAHVLALAYPPQVPANRGRFVQALLEGHPYMLWPSTAPGEGEPFRAALRDWLARQRLDELPEALCLALKGDRLLPPLVLLLDDPGSNPLEGTGYKSMN